MPSFSHLSVLLQCWGYSALPRELAFEFKVILTQKYRQTVPTKHFYHRMLILLLQHFHLQIRLDKHGCRKRTGIIAKRFDHKNIKAETQNDLSCTKQVLRWSHPRRLKGKARILINIRSFCSVPVDLKLWNPLPDLSTLSQLWLLNRTLCSVRILSVTACLAFIMLCATVCYHY